MRRGRSRQKESTDEDKSRVHKNHKLIFLPIAFVRLQSKQEAKKNLNCRRARQRVMAEKYEFIVDSGSLASPVARSYNNREVIAMPVPSRTSFTCLSCKEICKRVIHTSEVDSHCPFSWRQTTVSRNILQWVLHRDVGRASDSAM